MSSCKYFNNNIVIISGTVDTVVSLQKREDVLDEIYVKAKQKAIDQGADPSTLRLVHQEISPIPMYTTKWRM